MSSKINFATCKRIFVSLTVVLSALVAIEWWYAQQPELAFELKFSPSEPEEFECTVGLSMIRARGDWVILAKNLSPTPILIDSLHVVTWHRGGGVVFKIEERNELKRSGSEVTILRLENFRIDGKGFEKRIQSDWFPEVSERASSFIKSGGCKSPASWRAYQLARKTKRESVADYTATLNVTYEQGKSFAVTANYDPTFQTLTTRPVKLFSFFGLGR